MSALALTLSERAAKLALYLRYPFVQNALIVSALVALSAALLGVFLTLKRFSAIGDGLSHVAFGAAAIAAVFDIFDLSFTLPVTIIAAVIILNAGSGRRTMGDAAIAMLSTGALAVGYTVLNLFGGSANLGGDVCSALFGSAAMLTLTKSDVMLALGVTAALVILIIIFYYKLLSVTFDESFSKATGTRTGAYNLVIAIVCATVIVMGMKLAGALLISALIVFPALSAMRLFKGFASVLVTSGIIAVVGATLGVLVSILLETPVGATIAAVDVVAYGLCCLVRK